MMSPFNFLVVVLSLVVTAYAASNKKDMLNMVNNVMKDVRMTKPQSDDDKGGFFPCKTGDPKFTLNWTPKDIKVGDTVVGNFDMTPTVDLNGGNVEATVYLPEYPDPIYQVTQPFTCDQINKFLPNSCPAKKGKEIKIVDYKYKLPTGLPIPPGTFIIMAKITNQQGGLFACMNGSVSFTQDYDYDNYDNYDY